MPTPTCLNHPNVEAIAPCTHCGRPFCSGCLVEMVGRLLCAECKETALQEILVSRRQYPLALPALIVPIVGWMTCVLPPITGSVGLWLGWRALRDIRANSRWGGRTLALVGMVISGATLADWLIALAATILFRFSS